jgi:hypothetical protein
MESKAAIAFKIEGELSVVNATTVICLRRAPDAGSGHVLDATQFDGMGGAMLKLRAEVTFTSGWQVLMGQAEVKNWMRSDADSTTTMRYAGEYKFAAGLLTQGVPGVPQDPVAPRGGPLGSSPDRERAIGWIGNAPALVPGPSARL